MKKFISEVEKFTTATKIAADFQVSRKTVSRRLNDRGLFCRKAALHSAELTERHREQRIAFIEENYHLDWDKVVFSDEKTFKSYSDQRVEHSGRIGCGVWGFTQQAVWAN